MAGIFALTLVAAALIPASTAFAAHGPETPGGPYAGYTSGAAVHVDAVTTSSARLADLEVGVANAAMDSEGLGEILNVYQRPVVPETVEGAHARGHSSLVELGAVLQPPKAPNQVAPFVAQANAPGGERVDQSLLDTTVNPLIDVSLLRRVADANWNNATCVIGEPIAIGEQHLARVELLESGDEAATPAELGFDKPLIGIEANKAGPRRAATHVIAREQLYAGAGGGFGLQSLVTETLAPITLLEGTPNEFTIEIQGPAYLVAQANGTAGGAKTIYRAPLVSVIRGGEATQVLPSAPLTLRVPGTGDIIAQVKLGVMDALPGSGLGAETVRSNGTLAAAQANVVEVTLLDAASPKLRGATIALGHMEARADVPAGGIDCPIPVTKTPNPAEVTVGERFITTITVDNPFACPITNLSLTDAITVEQGARFQVMEVSDGGTKPGGSNLSNATVNWANLGTLQPGGKKSVTIDLLAQGAAGIIRDTATAGGTLTNCLASPGSADADVSAMAKVNVKVEGEGEVSVPASVVLGKRILPRTGVGAVAPALGGLSLLGAAGALLRRMRKPLL